LKVLYITYENVFRTGILQAMVIKPLLLMSDKYNIHFTLTSTMKKFENDEIYRKNKLNFENLKVEKINISEFEKNLSNKLSVFTFVKDMFPMVKFAINEAKSSDVIHCRSYGGALIGLIASMVNNTPYIFDMRGCLPEETVEIGKIGSKSVKFKLLKFIEKILIKKAAHVFTVSNKFNDYIKNSFNKEKCSNINNPTDFNIYFHEKRNNRRINFIYSGSMKIWHLPKLTIKYFSKIVEKYGDKVYLYFCSNDNVTQAKKIFEQYNVPQTNYEIKNVPYNDMPKYYAKVDIAFCFAKNLFSRSICFPVKFSEYIASELFILSNKGIGDLADIIEKHKCGLAFDNLNDIDNNIKEISKIIDKLSKNDYITCNKYNLNYLDWNNKIDAICNIYKKIIRKNKNVSN